MMKKNHVSIGNHPESWSQVLFASKNMQTHTRELLGLCESSRPGTFITNNQTNSRRRKRARFGEKKPKTALEESPRIFYYYYSIFSSNHVYIMPSCLESSSSSSSMKCKLFSFCFFLTSHILLGKSSWILRRNQRKKSIEFRPILQYMWRKNIFNMQNLTSKLRPTKCGESGFQRKEDWKFLSLFGNVLICSQRIRELANDDEFENWFLLTLFLWWLHNIIVS